VSRNHRTPGIIRVLCTHTYHHDSREFAEYGFHHLCTLKLQIMSRVSEPSPVSGTR
jgi:hypothetical protein